MNTIDCQRCTACCRKDVVVLGPGDDRDELRWHAEWHNGVAHDVLDRDELGDCIYVTPMGCSIHGSAPMVCRRMDCRTLLCDTTPSQREARVRQNTQMIHVYVAGAKRLHTLEA